MADRFSPTKIGAIPGYSRSLAIDAIEQGRADLVAFGQSFIANPDLVTRLKVDAPLAQAPLDVFYGGGARGYTDWPSMSQATRRIV
jgi:N-ethylmaleimide reductase